MKTYTIDNTAANEKAQRLVATLKSAQDAAWRMASLRPGDEECQKIIHATLLPALHQMSALALVGGCAGHHEVALAALGEFPNIPANSGFFSAARGWGNAVAFYSSPICGASWWAGDVQFCARATRNIWSSLDAMANPDAFIQINKNKNEYCYFNVAEGAKWDFALANAMIREQAS